MLLFSTRAAVTRIAAFRGCTGVVLSRASNGSHRAKGKIVPRGRDRRFTFGQ